MALQTMYPAMVNSPELSLKTAITSPSQTSIVISGSVSTKFPSYPNLLVIGTGEDAETIRFTEAPTGNDTDGWTYANVERGFQGSPNTWSAGTPVSRLFTAYDNDTFRANILDLDTRKLEAAASEFAAIVYQDGTNTYARDKDGNVLSQVTRVSKTDSTPIQAAIDYANNSADAMSEALGKVVITKGDYYVQSKITVKFGVTVECLNYDTVFYVETNHDVIQIRSHSYWRGGVIYITSGNTSFSSTCMLLDASADNTLSGIGHAYNLAPYIKEVLILKATAAGIGGKGIWLKNEVTTDRWVGIIGVTFEDITITGQFDYSLYASVGTSAYAENIAFCTFKRININNFIRGIYVADTGTSTTLFGINFFEDITLQTYTGTHPEIIGIYLNGSGNTFDNVSVMDWQEYGGYSLYLTPYTAKNVLNNVNVEYIQQVSDRGRFNTIKFMGSNSIPDVVRNLELTPNNCTPALTDGVAVTTTEMTTNLFPVKYGAFTTAGEGTERMCWLTTLDRFWEGSGRLPTGASTYTMSDTPLETTTTRICLVSTTLSTRDDFYIGWKVTNVTRSYAESYVTAFDADGNNKTFTISPAISGQDSGDTFYLENPGKGKFYGEISWTSTEASHYDRVKWLLYAYRVGDGLTMTSTLPLVATFMDSSLYSASAYGGRTTRLMLRYSGTCSSSTTTTLTDANLHGVYFPSNNTGYRTLSYIWIPSLSLGAEVSSFDDSTHIVTFGTITGLSGSVPYELYVTDYPFTVPGRGDIVLWELRRGTVGDDLAHDARFFNMNITYKVGKRANI